MIRPGGKRKKVRGIDYVLKLKESPHTVLVRMAKGRLRFTVIQRGETYGSMRLELTAKQSQDFFRQLAQCLDYSVQGGSEIDPEAVAGVYWDLPRGRRDGAQMWLEVHGTDRSMNYFRMTTKVSSSKMLEFVKGIAGPLGWELSEWWEEE